MSKISFVLLLVGLAYSQLHSAQSFERQILASTDDAEEKYNGSYVTTSSSDIEMMYDSWNDQGLQTVGLRFDNISIPSNSNILSAYIQFTADGNYSGEMTMTIHGENVANSIPFANTFNNISGRTQTTSSVLWDNIANWSDEQAGTGQRTPDLSAIVNEIIGASGWLSANPVTFIISGTGGEDQSRRAYSYDENSLKSAKLVLEYESNTAVDLAVVDCITPTDAYFPNAEAEVQVEITSYGNLTASDYMLSYFIDGNLIASESGLTPINIGETILFTFTQTTDLSVLGNYELSIELTISDDENISNNTFVKTVSIIDEVDPLLFDQGSAWRYWDILTNPGFLWNTVGFDDSLWPVGIGHFGFGDGDEQTNLNNGIISYYFRKKVEVIDIDQLDKIYFNMVHDDGAIIYVNGQEVLRTEMMPLGAILHSTTARQSINSTTQNEFFTYGIDPSYFVNGENTIAVSVRNRNSSDGDLSFDCFITPVFIYDQDGPYVYYDDENIIVQEVTPAGLVSNTYTTAEGLELTCELPHMSTSFSFTLHPEITLEPSVFPETPSKLLAVSDFDGHIEGFSMLLRGEGIMDENFNWTYGDGHLVISGDIFDRGFHITESMWLLYKLEAEAEAAGGKIHLIIGNHEMFNLTDDWRYVEVKYFNDAHLMGKRMAELYDADTELGRWLRSKNIIEEIGGHAYMHGGISPALSALNLTFDEINEHGRTRMNGESCFSSACITVNSSDNGIYWYRGMVEEELTQTEVDGILDGLDIGRVILGHTKDNTIRSLYDGRVIAIDMYHIDNFESGYMEALQFELGCFYIFHTDGIEQDYTLLNECDEPNNILEINGDVQLKIYPNPTSSILNIEMPNHLAGGYNYTIVDMEGKMVSQGRVNQNVSSIEVDQYATGKYILTLQNSDRVIRGHFILRN